MGDPARIFFKNPGYDGQLARTLSMTAVHAADLGEALATARRIRKLDGASWHDAWSRAANRADDDAAAALVAGDPTSARHAHLRASEYHRQSYYFLRSDPDDPRMRDAHRRHVEAFRAAVSLMEHPATEIRFPYEDITIKGYLYAPDSSGTARPTVVLPSGYDSTAEAGWLDVPAALDRGYNALVFEGPGQGEALLDQRRYFRPDFEQVLTPVLDTLLARPEVDPTVIVLVGRSFGGYLAPRAAAFEHRIAALVCDPAQPDMGARIPRGVAGAVAVPVVKAQIRADADRAEFFGARMAAHGIRSVGRYFAELRRYSMLALAPQISCPVLVVEAENDFAGGSGQAMVDAVGSRARLIRLTADEGADGHCAGLGQQVWAGAVYPWVHGVLAARDRNPPAG